MSESLEIRKINNTPLIFDNYQETKSLSFLEYSLGHVILASDIKLNITLENNSQAYIYIISKNNLNINFDINSNSYLEIAYININNQEAHNILNINLLAPGAQVNFLGLDNLKNNHTSSLKLFINHETENTKSSQNFRGIYAHDSHGAFLGKVKIFEHAKNSSAKQLYKSILLDKNSRAEVKPELEINNFDIIASHGATIGQLDQEALFYLRSRGLNFIQAQEILVKSLANDILDSLNPSMRKNICDLGVLDA